MTATDEQHRRITGKIVIATHNAGKLREMHELLSLYGVEAEIRGSNADARRAAIEGGPAYRHAFAEGVLIADEDFRTHVRFGDTDLPDWQASDFQTCGLLARAMTAPPDLDAERLYA